MEDQNRISEPEVTRNSNGKITAVRFAFGPHYFVEVTSGEEDLTFHVGATHHGISADASEVGGELEQFVEELKKDHPDKAF